MKKIIVPVDFSPISNNAAEYAADLACVLNIDLSLLHVCRIPMNFSEVPAPTVNLEEIKREGETAMVELREKILLRIKDRIKVFAEVRMGDVVGEIDKYCSKVNPYAVVMGAEGTTSLERVLFGGKTITAMRKLSWPLIIIPPQARFAGIKKIGLACDLKNVIDTIPFYEIKNLVRELKAELHILHVSLEHGDEFSEETIEESGWLQDVLGDLNPKYHFIEELDTDTAITNFAEQNGIDMLIVIPKKHRVIDKIFQHSHSKRLVLHTHVPLMTVHE